MFVVLIVRVIVDSVTNHSLGPAFTNGSDKEMLIKAGSQFGAM